MNHPFLKSFGRRIKALRNHKNLSQEQLAQIAELDRTYISGIERGVRNVSLLTIEKLALSLQIEPAELLKFDEADND